MKITSEHVGAGRHVEQQQSPVQLLPLEQFHGPDNREALPVVQREAEEGWTPVLLVRGHILRPVHNIDPQRAGLHNMQRDDGFPPRQLPPAGVVLERGAEESFLGRDAPSVVASGQRAAAGAPLPQEERSHLA